MAAGSERNRFFPISISQKYQFYYVIRNGYAGVDDDFIALGFKYECEVRSSIAALSRVGVRSYFFFRLQQSL